MISRLRRLSACLLLAACCLLPALASANADQAAGGGAGGHGAAAAELGRDMPLWTVGPFVMLLLLIAVMPLFAGHWWEHNSNKGIIVALLIAPIAFYLPTFAGVEGAHQVVEKILEYIQFMLLLGALYIISGGIYVQGSLPGTPLSNAGLLLLGALLASVIGTTGASVLLIRPLLRANKTRERKAHIVVFFIFIVSNCGGLLTPLGDPPLFMGFLKGVPFEWTFFNLWQPWLVVNAALLIIFLIMDNYIFDKEEQERPGSQLEEVIKHEPVAILGGLNFLFLLGVVAVIFFSGRMDWPKGVPEIAMAALALASYFTTAKSNHEKNKFSFGPIIEVAVLFIGIFITMAPALLILNAWGSHHRDLLGFQFGLEHPWQFFWATGILSSFLDNAPTYLTLAATAAGAFDIAPEGSTYLLEFLNASKEGAPSPHRLLAAISAGAVFMGANTYIGNGPNFMVKAIAEENGVPMPSFFGYMVYSGAILIPIFIVVTIAFFRA